jgi:hypothetical protein
VKYTRKRFSTAELGKYKGNYMASRKREEKKNIGVMVAQRAGT